MPIVDLANLSQFAAVNLASDPGVDKNNPVIPQCAVITLTWILEDGKVARNVLHGSYQGGFAGTQAQCNAILSGLGTGAQWTALAGFLAPTTALAFVSLRDINTRDQPIISSNGASHPGTSASPSLPNETAAVITLRTAFTGRQHRGRIYVPGFATNALGAGNVIAASALTAIANWGSIIYGVLLAQGYQFSIGHLHRIAYTSIKGTPHADRPAGTVPVQSTECRDNHWDSQRRRGLK